MSRAVLLVLASALMDFTSYLYFFAVTVRARSVHGFGAVENLLLGSGFAAVYGLSCYLTTGISEGRPRHHVIAAGIAGAVMSSLVAWSGGSLAALLGALAFLGISNGLFWPALQARFGDLSADARALQARLGFFNIAWCGGKSVGVVLAGAVLAAGSETASVFVAAAGLQLAVGAIAVTGAWGAAPTPRPAAAEGPRGERGFLPAARLANFVCWGGSALLTWAVEKRSVELSLGTEAGGRVLGATFASEAVTFVALALTGAWRYRAAPLFVLEGVGAGGYALLAFARSEPALLAGAGAAGVAIGMAYYASIFYSLELGATRSHGAGIHETILGGGAVLVPLAGAGAAWATGWGGAPFALVAVLTAGSLPVQGLLLRRSAKGSGRSRCMRGLPSLGCRS